MAKLQYRTISARAVEALSVEKDTVFWDTQLKGFGVRVYPSGSKMYVVQSRGPAGPKRVTVGRHGVISADRARRRAASIVARIKAGEPPVPRRTPAVGRADGGRAAERYFREHVEVRCKPRTAEKHRYVVEKYILPGLGRLAISELGRRHAADLHYRLRGKPTTANEAVATLSRMLNRAEAWGLAPEGSNPCRLVVKYKRRKLERFLTEAEFRRLGRELAALEAEGRMPVHAAAALRLLMLTGCRCGEILTLRWEDVHPDAKELGSATARQVRGWCRCRRPRCEFSPACRGWPAIPGSSRAPGQAGTSRKSPLIGIGFEPGPASTTCGSMTSDTALPRGP